jgi:hypothetical protein
MAKYYGNIGFAKLVEKPGSIYEETVIEKPYFGDVLKKSLRYEPSSEKLSDDVKLNNEISILADSFAYQNSHLMRYVTYNGTKWKIASMTDGYPRIIISLGGVYNGPEPESSEASNP